MVNTPEGPSELAKPIPRATRLRDILFDLQKGNITQREANQQVTEFFISIQGRNPSAQTLEEHLAAAEALRLLAEILHFSTEHEREALNAPTETLRE